MTDLRAKRCVPCEGGVPPLTREQVQELLTQTPAWTVSEDGKKISRTFSFRNFRETMTFVNAVAEIANTENHHPDMLVKYSSCVVTLWTHAIDGLSKNDFIVAAKIDDMAHA